VIGIELKPLIGPARAESQRAVQRLPNRRSDLGRAEIKPLLGEGRSLPRCDRTPWKTQRSARNRIDKPTWRGNGYVRATRSTDLVEDSTRSPHDCYVRSRVVGCQERDVLLTG